MAIRKVIHWSGHKSKATVVDSDCMLESPKRIQKLLAPDH